MKLFSPRDMSFVDKAITKAYTLTIFITCNTQMDTSYYHTQKQTRIGQLLNLFSVWRNQFVKGFSTEFILFIFAAILLNIGALWLFDKFCSFFYR